MTHRLLSAAAARETVLERQGGMCASCWTGVRPDEAHAHHRQRRRDLGWCPCNVVILHGDCHVIAPGAVHQRPAWARERGLIVPTWDDPRVVPLWVGWPWRMWSLLDCAGSVSTVAEQTAPPT